MKAYDLLHLYTEYSIKKQDENLLDPLSHLHKIAFQAASSITPILFGELGKGAAEHLGKYSEFLSHEGELLSNIVGISNYHQKKYGPSFIGVSMVYPLMDLRGNTFFNRKGIDIYFQTVLAPQTQKSTQMLQEYIAEYPDNISHLPLYDIGNKFLFGAGLVITDYKDIFHNNLAMFGPMEYPFLSIRPEDRRAGKKVLEPLRGDIFETHAPILLKAYQEILTNSPIITNKKQ